MSISVEFQKPTVKGAFDWQLSQEINIKNEQGTVVAKAEIELVTLNKHRDSEKSFELIDEQEATDWEIPFGIYFKKQNLINEYCEKLAIKPDTNAKTHIMIEAISVQKDYRNKGVAKQLLKEIVEHYPKVQSLNVMSLAMNQFVDLAYCNGEENTQYYQSLDLDNETMSANELDKFWTNSGFMQVDIDEELLADPLPYNIFVASPASILLKTNK